MTDFPTRTASPRAPSNPGRPAAPRRGRLQQAGPSRLRRLPRLWGRRGDLRGQVDGHRALWSTRSRPQVATQLRPTSGGGPRAAARRLAGLDRGLASGKSTAGLQQLQTQLGQVIGKPNRQLTRPGRRRADRGPGNGWPARRRHRRRPRPAPEGRDEMREGATGEKARHRPAARPAGRRRPRAARSLGDAARRKRRCRGAGELTVPARRPTSCSSSPTTSTSCSGASTPCTGQGGSSPTRGRPSPTSRPALPLAAIAEPRSSRQYPHNHKIYTNDLRTAASTSSAPWGTRAGPWARPPGGRLPDLFSPASTSMATPTWRTAPTSRRAGTSGMYRRTTTAYSEFNYELNRTRRPGQVRAAAPTDY